MGNMVADNRQIWEERYRQGQTVLHYPFDSVVTFVFQKLPRPTKTEPVAVLDFGCGTGNHLTFLIENGYAAFGVDVAPTALRYADKALVSRWPDYPKGRIALMDGNRIPFADSHFDAVIDRSSLGQNRTADIRALVGEIYRVLKPGGRYFGVNFSDRHPDLKFGTAIGGGDYSDFTDGVFKGIGARHFFGLDEIRKLFAPFDLDDIRLLSEESVFGKGGMVQIAVEAVKPR